MKKYKNNKFKNYSKDIFKKLENDFKNINLTDYDSPYEYCPNEGNDKFDILTKVLVAVGYYVMIILTLNLQKFKFEPGVDDKYANRYFGQLLLDLNIPFEYGNEEKLEINERKVSIDVVKNTTPSEFKSKCNRFKVEDSKLNVLIYIHDTKDSLEKLELEKLIDEYECKNDKILIIKCFIFNKEVLVYNGSEFKFKFKCGIFSAREYFWKIFNGIKALEKRVNELNRKESFLKNEN